MFHHWLRKRREAKLRARDYALYYRKQHGDAAEDFVLDNFGDLDRFSYRGMLGQFILRELRREPDPAPPPSRRRRRGTA